MQPSTNPQVIGGVVTVVDDRDTITVDDPSLRAPPFLSLCVIVKDGEQTIGALLESVLRVDGIDEVVVVDTGSQDNTRAVVWDKLLRFPRGITEHLSWLAGAGDVRFDQQFGPGGRPIVVDGGRGRWLSDTERDDKAVAPRIVLARFDWTDDFAAARNYAFSLATGEWRMYLDADDVLECRHPAILAGEKRADGSLKRFNLAASIKSYDARVEPRGSLNAISMPYEYKQGDTTQDVFRIWRWKDGWAWRDAVHEAVVATPKETSHLRVIAHVLDAVVVHGKTDEGNDRSHVRNRRILERELARTDLPQDQRDRYMYGYSNSLRGMGDFKGAVAALEHVIENCRGTNFEIFAQCDLVKMLGTPRERGLLEQAVDHAGHLVARYPEVADGYEHLGWVHALLGNFTRAAATFDAGVAVAGRLPVSSNKEIWFTDGAARAARALAYAKKGRISDALDVLRTVEHVMHPQVRALHVEATRVASRAMGVVAALNYVDFLLRANEPLIALDFLRRQAQVGVLEGETRAFGAKLREVEDMLPQCESYEAYVDAYSSLPEHTTRVPDAEMRAAIFDLVRVQVLLAWVDSLPKEGPPVELLLVGVQDGVYEAEVLRRNPRICVTVSEIAGASKATLELVAEFGDRVSVHHMTHLTDWDDGMQYDAVACFEVIEHFQEDATFVSLRHALKRGGRLFLSTPVPDLWVEEPQKDRPFAHHVQAWGPRRLFEALRAEDFAGELCEGRDSTLVFDGVLSAVPLPTPTAVPKLRVAVFVPEQATPFDARSGERGHLGGSEEAIIHLSRELAALGHDVVVYAPIATGDVGRIIAKDGVYWRSSSEFDVGDSAGAHDAVLFWRCPDIMRLPAVKDARYKKALWLHDSWYDAAPEAYAAADVVVALSRFHKDVLIAKDGAPDGSFVVLQNGIDPAEFPPLDADSEEKRDPYKVLYTSSPDRGLATLLDLWPKIKAREPRASLDIYYDWKGARWLKPELVTMLEEHLKFLADYEVPRADGNGTTKMDVRYLGGVDHATLHAAMRAAGVWAYPHFGTAPSGKSPSPETFCITAVKVQAAGMRVVATDAGALPEVLGPSAAQVELKDDGQLDEMGQATFILGVLDRFSDPRPRAHIRERALARFAWAKTAAMFEDVLAPKRSKAAP